MAQTLFLLRDCHVVASSGCHRYDYWNEQALFDGRLDTGWCTPSRTNAQTEFIKVDLGGDRQICRVRMLSRSINRNAGFPTTFRISTSDDGTTWLNLVEEKSYVSEVDCWHEWDFDTIGARYLKIDVDEVDRRPEGKYFVQFMALEVYSPQPILPGAQHVPGTLMKGTVVDARLVTDMASTDQPNKFGVWSSPQMQTTLWALQPGQTMIVHKHHGSDETIVVLRGNGHLEIGNAETGDIPGQYIPSATQKVLPGTPAPQDSVHLDSRPVTAGQVMVVPQDTFHGVRNTGDEEMVLVVTTAPEPRHCVYTTR